VVCAAQPDTTPPSTRITKHPKARIVTRSKRASVRFAFASSEAGSTFSCKLDSGSFRPCASAKTYKLKPGRHTFGVRATDGAGNTDPSPAKFVVKVIRKR
jgi:hypothetical protein